MSREERLRHLGRCKALLLDLHPDHPPDGVSCKEFLWQYSAFQQRLEAYEALLNERIDAISVVDSQLEQAEFAIDLSLSYLRACKVR
jgi:hypothetical protein